MSSTQSISRASILDGLGRQVKAEVTSAPEGIEYTDTTYDGLGRVASVSNPYLTTGDPTYGSTSYIRDALGRTTKVTEPDGNTQQWCYEGIATTSQSNCAANASTKTSQSWTDYSDENGNHHQRLTDGLDRLDAVMEPDPSTGADTLEADYQLDPLGDILDIDQWGGPFGDSGDRSRLFHYDGLSRVVSAQNPETGSVLFTYTTSSGALCSGDPSDVCTRTDARGIVTTYSYDSLNRLIERSYSDGTLPVNFVYDETSGSVHPGGDYGFGVQNITNGIGRVTYEYVGSSAPGEAAKMLDYDAMGRETAAWQCWDFMCTDTSGIAESWQTYDLAGNIDYVNDGSGNGMYTGYDGAGRVSAVTTVPQPQLEVEGFPAETLISSVVYGPACPTQVTLGDGQAESYGYDKRMRVSSYQRTNAADPSKNDYGYSLQYYPNGDVETATETFAAGSGSWQYNYDDLDRLTSAINASFGEGCAYSYGAYGNMTSEGPAGTGSDQCFSQSFSYGGNGVQNLNGISGYCYDASGNLLDDGPCPSSGAHKYAYDGEGRLASANYGAETFVYDADGRRVGASNGSGGYANVVYNDVTGEPLGQWTNNELTGARDLWVNGRHIGYFLNNALTWTATDWLGSERVRTDSSGNLIGAFESLPFGNGQVTLSGSDNDNIHFTGKERDVESGLDYFGARYYSSSMGRFSIPDPSGLAYADQSNPQSLNLYSYALNNPLKNTDPTGLYCYYGSTAEDSGDASQYDFHSSEGECTAADENGNKGEWVPDPTTTVNVNAETGDTDTLSVFTGNTGNVQNQTTQSSHTTGCPAVPTAPSGVSVNENMQIAKLSYLFQPPPFNQLWFRDMVNYGGVWDYKTQGAQYENFGNFNYGATGTAAGAPPFTLRRAAGRAQRGHAGSPQFGGDPGSLPSIFLNPGGGTAPYGDDPNDQKFINLGIKYAQMGCTG
jgi:RHS repeat-associated protein